MYIERERERDRERNRKRDRERERERERESQGNCIFIPGPEEPGLLGIYIYIYIQYI